jgi:hypothetical protein
MLPAPARVHVQPDESSILTSLFAERSVPNKEHAYPCDIDHYSQYEMDVATDDRSALLSRNLTYSELHHLPTYYYSNQTLHGVPTIWQCVKNAFTMPFA